MVREVVSVVLLFAGVTVGLLSALAIVPLRSAFDRLHFLGPVAMLGTTLIVLAIVVREGLSAVGMKSVLAGILVILMSPIITHMTARARWQGRRRRLGRSRPQRSPGDEERGG